MWSLWRGVLFTAVKTQGAWERCEKDGGRGWGQRQGLGTEADGNSARAWTSEDWNSETLDPELRLQTGNRAMIPSLTLEAWFNLPFLFFPSWMPRSVQLGHYI